MGARRERRLLETAAPMMQPGETPEVIAMAKVGSLRKVLGEHFALGIATAVLSGGTMFSITSQRELYLLLTDRQLLFFEADVHTGGPGKALFGVPRTHVAITEPKGGFLVKFELRIHGWDQVLTLSMPPFPPSMRKKGLRLIAGLPRLEHANS
ncbi:hypothetical protein H4696_008112 [Amycolatopsis lexingtonensis]|uniref:YokE-like PH domain-containing protein n=1 Tax=Amycolatopsis lexingtonensis TaxID=218822 RepID=A0ABR9ICX0_9PSEU|nr:hypothetical protein [Amycolatopsis lexingtonensis]MBE1501012.1 hypothetical protein [Amycolatopsis lexingtonensis]